MYAKLNGKLTNGQGVQLKQHHHVSIDKEFKNDCAMWVMFLNHQAMVNRKFTDLDQSRTYTDVSFFSDSSRNPDLGFGCFFQNRWMFGKWEVGFIEKYEPSIAYLELFALVLGIIKWESQLRSKYILIHCDNQSVVQMVNNATSSCKNCMYLLRLLTLNNMINDRAIKVVYIETKKIFLAYLLSRQKIKKFLEVAPGGTRAEPDSLPQELWPLSKIWQK